MPTQHLPERLMPLAAAAGLRPFYGDLHNHCNLSYGHGDLEAALNNARSQLDFVSITGHAYWPDMPVDDPRVAHIVDFHVKGFSRLEEAWPGHFDSLAAYHRPGSFTVFPGYEIHSCAHGDYTIVLRDLDQREILKADDPHTLLKRLRGRYGDRAFAFPHHIGYRTGARGINWSSVEEELSPVLEMISMHGCAETSLTDRPFLHSMGPCDGSNTVHAGLNDGHVFGVLGNTDHHSGFPGSYGHGRSAVYARENTSDALWQGLFSRHTNALTGDNAHLFLSIGGAMQGDIVEPAANAELKIEAVAGSFIDYVDIVRNGALFSRISPALRPSPVADDPAMLETILVLELGWGGRGSYHDWDGVVSLEGGEILAVEPRLRGPEVVSPTEAAASAPHESRIESDAGAIRFSLRAHANPNNFTSATQAIAARVRIGPDARILADLSGCRVAIDAGRLRQGAVSGNIGPIDSPAYRFHPLPRPQDWQWTGSVPLGEFKAGDWVMARMRQANGQWAWTSPIFCR